MRHALVVLAALALAAPALGDSPPPGPPPNAQQQAAIAACKAQGLAAGSDAFNQCIAKQLGLPAPKPAPTPPPGGGGQGQPTPAFQSCQAKGLQPGSDTFNACVKAFDAAASAKPAVGATPAQKAAIAACKSMGFVENTSDFQTCIKQKTSVSGATTDAEKSAEAGCAASGLKPLTDAYHACVNATLQAGAIAGFTGEQMAAYNACKTQGIALNSNAFAQCLSKMLTKVIPDKGKAATGELDKVLAACNASHPKTAAAMQQCVRTGLGS